MSRRFLLLILLVALPLQFLRFAQAQDMNWTCDNGPNDVLNAAQAAYDAGDFDLAYELAQVAESVCSSGTADNLIRRTEATRLRTQLEQETTVTFTLMNSFDAPICFVYFTLSTNTDNWEAERLSSTDTLNPGTEHQWVIAAGIYDVLLLNCAEETLAEITELAMTNDYRWEASPAFMDRFSTWQELTDLGWDATDQGRYDEALAHFEQTFLLAHQNNDRVGEGIALASMGWVYDVQGQYALALDYYEQALAIFREVGSRAREGNTLHDIGWVYDAQKQYALALDYYEQALAIFREVGDQAGEEAVLHNVESLPEDQGQPESELDDSATTATFTLANGFDVPICAVYFTLITNSDWGEERLDGTEMIQPGSEHQWVITSGMYHVRLLDCAEETLAEITEMAVIGDYRWEASPARIDRYSTWQELTERGRDAFYAGRYDEALALYEQALVIAREIGDRGREGDTLNDIGSVHHAQAQYGQALVYYEQALTVFRAARHRAGEGTTLSNIGNVYHDQGLYGQALVYYEQALAGFRAAGYHAAEGATLGNIGLAYKHQGQYALALTYYELALATARELGDRAGEGIILDNIGNVYVGQGQYALALAYAEQALAIFREVGNRAGEGTTLNNIGLVYHLQGQQVLALDYYARALTIAREVGNRAGEGNILDNIGLVYYDQRQYKRALDYAEQALAIFREVGDLAAEGFTLHNIGLMYDAQGQYTQALDYYEQALTIARKVGDLAAEGAHLHNIGAMYKNQGQYTLALNYFEQALAIHREVGNRAGEIATLADRALVLELLGEFDRAIADYVIAVELSEGLTSDAALDDAITSLLGQWQHNRPYERLAILLAWQGDVAQALDYAEGGRAVLIRTDLTSGSIDFRAGLDDDLLARETDLRLALDDAQNAVDALARDPSATGADRQLAQTALQTAQRAYDDHLMTMQLQGGFLAREVARETAPLAAIQTVLSADTTLMVYSLSNPNSVLFLVTHDSLNAVILDVTADEIEEAATRFMMDRRANADVLREVYDLVIAPFADQLDTAQLIIVPDGALNYIPFAALQAPNGRYLIDDYTISMVSSATTLVLLHDRDQASMVTATQPALTLAQSSAPPLPTLRNASLEALAVADLLDTTPTIDATEADLRTHATGAPVIHLSAHVELDRFAPLFSVIRLGTGGDYDGRLEVREIYELDLSQGTELVVLSGCETASGGDGEDFGLLMRAFFAAGTPRVIASLWAVDDAATTDLMTAFYTARAEHDTDAKALRAAMLATRVQYPEPYFWASFTLNGLP